MGINCLTTNGLFKKKNLSLKLCQPSFQCLGTKKLAFNEGFLQYLFSFSLNISSVALNVSPSRNTWRNSSGNCEFESHYWSNPYRKTSFFCAVSLIEQAFFFFFSCWSATKKYQFLSAHGERNFMASWEVVVRRCSVKKMFLEISQNSQENTCASLFFNKTPFFTEHLWRLLLPLFKDGLRMPQGYRAALTRQFTFYH